MFRGWMLAALLLTSAVPSGQASGVLRVTVSLPDATQVQVPVEKHALLISDNPATREPRRVVTAANGVVVINLAPGSYIVESDRPVGFLGQAYEWATVVEIVAGRETTLALTAQNADVVPMIAAARDPGAPAPSPNPSIDVGKWQPSLVTIWSATSQATGFVVDARGLIATDRNAVGSAATVEVQLTPSLKVPARVLAAELKQDVAIVWVDPRVLNRALPSPLVCPAAPAPSLENGNEIVTLTSSLRGTGDVVDGEITGFHSRGIETDLRLSFGQAGGPVFTGSHETVVGLTSIQADASRRGDVLLVRAGIICEAMSAAASKMSGTTPPEPTPLPVEPSRSYPTASVTTSTQAKGGATAPPVVSSSDFDVTFITPATVLRARERSDWTGGRGVRTPEAEARLGRLTDFGSLADYFTPEAPVLIVRVTPRLVESFWKRLAREAARTQGAALPAFKDFTANFLRMRATCGDAVVLPIHPFVLEHAAGDKRVVREGLYVFGPDIFGPQCGTVTLTLSSEQAPEKGEVLAISPKVIDQIWQDFAPYRAAGQ